MTVTWKTQETVESIDEVVEVPEPLKDAVRISVEALMNGASWEMEKEQQIYVDIAMFGEVQRR